MKLCAALLGMLAFFLANMAGADEPLNPALFDKLDANQDGTITSDEIPEQGRRLFDRMLRTSDKNKDGELTKAEFNAGITEKDEPKQTIASPRPRVGRQVDPKQIMARLDRDGDGKLSMEEFPADRRERIQQILPRIDRDGDLKLDAEEFGGMVAAIRGQNPPKKRPDSKPSMSMAGPNPPLLAALDTNGDGSIDTKEMEAAAQSLKKLDRNDDGKIDASELGFNRAMPRKRPARGAGVEAILGRIMQADTNGDGKLSAEEAPERMKPRFDAIDRNSDGFADKEEIKAMLSRFLQNRPKK